MLRSWFALGTDKSSLRRLSEASDYMDDLEREASTGDPSPSMHRWKGASDQGLELSSSSRDEFDDVSDGHP